MERMYWMVFVGSVALFSSLFCGTAAHAAVPDPCSLITSAQVAAALGVPGVTETKAPSMCGWRPTDPNIRPAKHLTVVLLPDVSEATMKGGGADEVTTVNGLGDSAMQVVIKKRTHLIVTKGGVHFQVSVEGVPMDQAKEYELTIAKQILKNNKL